MTRFTGVVALSLVAALAGVLFAVAAEPKPEVIRSQAQKDLEKGNFREAWEAYRQLAIQENAAGPTLADDVEQAVDCLSRLQRISEVDAFLAEVLAVHGEDPWLLWRAGKLLTNIEHFGFLVAGEFHRGHQRGGGQFIQVEHRDRVQALMLMNRARQALPDDLNPPTTSQFYEDFANALQLGRDGQMSWQLQQLTDLSVLPDYLLSEYGNSVGDAGGAPVDENGNAVLYAVPESFEAAQNDGERRRWCLHMVTQSQSERANEMLARYADFLHQQFGVQTLQDWGIRLPGYDEAQEGEPQAGVWSLPSLGEDETIARLANGVKRFRLPDEHNPIRIYQAIAGGKDRGYADTALRQLAQIFEDRQQYPKAADHWRKLAQEFADERENANERLNQIVGNWGQFESAYSQPAGQGAKIDFRYRNARSVTFEAFAIKIPELIEDVKKYLQSAPAELDWQRLSIENIGYQIVEQNQRKYLGDKVANWSLELQPRPNHFDKRLTVATPLQKAGAYLVTAKIAGGNTTRILVWLDDTAIVRKQLDNAQMYYVADAVSGRPIEKAKVEFFGWKLEHVPNARRQFRVLTQNFARFTDAGGLTVTDQKLQDPQYQWIAIARGGSRPEDSARFAHVGFDHVWFGGRQEERYEQTKVYVITDRPVYRPDQKVQFKFWLREAKYDLKEGSRYAGQAFTVIINDPQGTEVFRQEFKTDEFGGLAGEYMLPDEAALGQYSIFLDPEHGGVHGGQNFLVEEYKKPEFEVTVDAPSEPVRLGETVTATIKAKYYYGAPVTQAKVKFKVERSAHTARWFPIADWDWLYGNGYWWFSPESNWYPGFRRWGCLPPIPIWRHWNPDPPELVLDREVEIGPDGTVQVEIDTTLAKALHGDEDHEYSVTAEVTDASRRTIVGTGKVLVSREPYRIFAWTTRGHYSVGDPIIAQFQARRLDGQGVQGHGTLQLLRISYQNGQPVEEVAQEWQLTTDENGWVAQTMKASQAGQYRLSLKLKSGDEAPVVEGGHLFVIRGAGFDGSEFQFNDLELIVDKQSYAPGEKVQLLINTNRVGSTVLLFVRPVNGVAQGPPQVVKLSGKSTTVELDVTLADMPNFFVEAVTVAGGDVHNTLQEVFVPPEKRVLNIEVVPSSAKYLPGEKADVEIKVTDPAGEPVVGSLVLSAYDRAVEYISGGSNVAEIREFFWKWRRSHNPGIVHNLSRWFGQILKSGEVPMADLGTFGGMVADLEMLKSEQAGQDRLNFSMPRGMLRKGGMGGGFGGAMPMAAPGAAVDAMMADGAMPAMGELRAAEQPLAQPAVRSAFADTAYWNATITTDDNGLAHVSFDMPENLSAWKLRAWGMGQGTRVGEGTVEVVTVKNIIVRLQAPRFFTETDEVILSAVVHNGLDQEKQVRVEIELEGGTLELIGDGEAAVPVTIPAQGEVRVDWRVRAKSPGEATVTMKALTDVESDAMRMTFPVQVHGILKTESFSGVVRAGEESDVIEFTIPAERQPEQSQLELRYSPTLAGAMVDALPYLVNYPYGCTEQTLNRFLPTVITQKILLEMGLDLAAIKEKRTNLNAQQIGDDPQRAIQWKIYDENPVFDAAEVARMVEQGVKDLTAMQNSDGGWGWFSGFGEHSYPHTTAVVVHGLQLAQANDVAIVDGVVERGLEWLRRHQKQEVALLQEGVRHEQDPKRKHPYKSQCSDIDALVFSVLVDANAVDENMQEFLFRDRLSLSLYSQSLLGMALHAVGAAEQRDTVVRNIDQFVKVDDENQTAFIDLPNQGYWWYWYGDTLEANAQYLKLLTRLNPEDPKAAGLVKYLLNNRGHRGYWRSTRTTAYTIEALAEYLKASGESQPNVLVEIRLDGELKQSVEITPEVLFSFNNKFVVAGADLTTGAHKLEITRKPLNADGKTLAPIYHNLYVTNFTQEDLIAAAGLEIKVGRKYYRLIQDKDAAVSVSGSRGQAVDQSVLKYNRVELANLDEVVSGDLVEVELEIDSKNDYEYIVFEDLKGAGFEPVTLQSGYTRDGLGAYVEFRDEKVAFFLRELKRGKHSVSYRVRAEVPGKFSALPTKASGMYAPELRANSDEIKIRIADRE